MAIIKKSTPMPGKPGKVIASAPTVVKKVVKPVKKVEVEIEDDDDYEGPQTHVTSKVLPKSAKTAPKDEAEKAPSDKSLANAETKDTGIITYREGSGSQLIVSLIAKHGFEKEKVLSEANAMKKAGKGFQECDPTKKYNTMSGIIKKLVDQGFTLPKTK